MSKVIGEERKAIGFIGAYVPEADKQRLQMLAKLRRKSVNQLLGEMVREATAPLAELNATKIRA